MIEPVRRKLGVHVREGLVNDDEDGELVLAIHDFSLPCRRFLVDHKVAEVGKVSITAEFLLRLLKTVGSCSEENAAAFFGYGRREMAYVLNEVEEYEFIARSDGRLALTATGEALFRANETEPAIYEVERRSLTVGFDLISLSPEDRRPLTFFERRLPELTVHDTGRVARAAEMVPESFRRFFGEISPRSDPTTTAKRSLYSIDNVAPKERFQAVVRVQVNARASSPSIGEVDLKDRWTDFELSDRAAIVDAAAGMLDKLAIMARPDDKEAYDLLIELAPEYLKEYTRRDGLAVNRFYRHAYTSRGDVRVDRPTVPVVGSLFTPENTRRVLDVVDYASRRNKAPAEALFWAIPQAPLWGSTTVLADVLEHVVRRIDASNLDLLRPKQISAVALSAAKPDWWINEAFSHLHCADAKVLPGALELLLIPGTLAAAMVHAPIGLQHGLPVPLGFVSFDGRVVDRVADLIERVSAPFGLDQRLKAQLALRSAIASMTEVNVPETVSHSDTP